MPDAYVIGAGPNGLAAAVTLAHAGLSVVVYEASEQPGGGVRSGALTLPGFVHDEFSAVHPLALASPFFRAWGLTDRVDFAIPDVAFAHPLGASSVRVHRDLDATLAELRDRFGPAAARLYARLVGPAARDLLTLVPLLLDAPVAARPTPAQLAAGLRFGAAIAELTARLGTSEWSRSGSGEGAALAAIAGCVSHAVSPLSNPAAVAAGLVLAASAHSGGWPIPVGGAQKIADALVADLVAHGGRLETGRRIERLEDLPDLTADTLVIADVPPQQAARWLGSEPGVEGYRKTVARVRPAQGVARVDFAVDAPIPWRDPSIAAAATVHVGGQASAMARFERQLARGRLSREPYVLLAQPTLFDPSRAPQGKHTVWAYTHAPRGSNLDVTSAITSTLERYAPGFSATVLASRAASPADLGRANPSLVGGDIAVGAITLRQVLARPTLTAEPWRTPRAGLFVCSAGTSPGPGVHGMNGYHAARVALRDRGIADPLRG